VDLPGDLLEVLVIVKLPFMVPTEPIVQARAARVSANGESPFEKLYMPDVVLKLRQGMGRLIRTSPDRGSVILLDRRLQHAEYGRAILSAVTERFDSCDSAEQLAECVGRDFAVSPPDVSDANERSA